jgi:glyoxylase-like metal-dependent hydrolase (beta-lactamase superfamily II)
MSMVDQVMEVQKFVSRGGIRVYGMPVETFPGHVNNIYLIVDGDTLTLVDVGSGTDESVEGLQQRIDEVYLRFGERVTLDDVRHVVITHAHIDHFGWVGHFTRETGARVWVHELDARVLSRFEERMVLASKDMGVFLERAGVKPDLKAELETMYRFSKALFKSVTIDGVVKDGQRIINGYLVHHTPGHCPGQICLEVDDLLFTADHVLSRITPHQSPASITPFCGLELYLQSLDKVRRLGGIKLALPGHEAPIEDMPARIGVIAAHHERRLGQVLELCREPLPLVEVSKRLFGPREGYTRLLALEEAGAHVEYLFQRGELGIANLDEVSEQANPIIRYETRRGAAA